MKAVILAGGLGTRISEESVHRPKPMVPIGGQPIMWHIMKNLSHQAKNPINEFVVCAGYKQQMIKEYFANLFLETADVTFDFTTGENNMIVHEHRVDPWKVTIADTGASSLTGGRLAAIKKYVEGERFLLTYGDGLADLDLSELIHFHEQQVAAGNIVTLTAANVGQQFGVIDISEDDEVKKSVRNFREKSDSDGGWVNAGFIICEKEIWEHVDETKMLEEGTLSVLADKGLLSAYKHSGFWKAMDSIRDRDILENLWSGKSGDDNASNNKAPWRNW